MKIMNKKTILILTIIVVALAFLLANLASTNNIKNTFDAGFDLQVTDVEKYSGPYMEDGSDEEVSNVMMITVKNNGEEPVQYGEITMAGKNGASALFKFSTLEPGQSVKVLESARKQYRARDKYELATAANVAYFQNKVKLYEDKLQIQPLDGGLNVTNISDKDINGEIVIYFKDCDGDMLMGGITYRGRIPGGIPAGGITQLMSENFTQENTKVMFITINGK